MTVALVSPRKNIQSLVRSPAPHTHRRRRRHKHHNTHPPPRTPHTHPHRVRPLDSSPVVFIFIFISSSSTRTRTHVEHTTRTCFSPKFNIDGVSRLLSSFNTTSMPFRRANATREFAFPKSIPTTLMTAHARISPRARRRNECAWTRRATSSCLDVRGIRPSRTTPRCGVSRISYAIMTRARRQSHPSSVIFFSFLPSTF